MWHQQWLLCIVALCIFLPISLQQTYDIITIDGSKSDWDAGTTASAGSDLSTWYFTWDDETFYIGVEAPDIGTRTQTTFLGVYFDVDPKLNPLQGDGTLSGKTYDYHTARLPFKADFYLEWIVGWDKTSLYYWDNRANAWLATPANVEYARQLNFIEFAVPLSWLTNPSRVYVSGAVVRSDQLDVIYDFTPDQEGPGDEFTIRHYWGFALIDGVIPNFEGLIDSYATYTMTNGDFFTNYIWNSNELPDSASTVYIRHTVTMMTEVTVKNLIFQGQGNLNITDLSYIQIRDGGSIVCRSRDVIPSVGTIEFQGRGRLAYGCGLTFANLVVFGSVDVGSSARILNSLKMMGRAQLINNSPLYMAHSNLIYCSGGFLDRSMEWSAMHGSGYPFTVIITSGTTLNVGTFNPYLNVGVASMLIITEGSTMDFNTPGFEQESPMYINENLQNDGTIVMSSADSGHLYVDGKIHRRGNIVCNGKSTLYDSHKTAFNKPKITASGVPRFPQGGNVTLDAGPDYDTYQWSSNAGSATSRAVTVGETGYYTVTITNQGCIATSDKFEVIVYGATSSIITGLLPSSSSASGTLSATLIVIVVMTAAFCLCVCLISIGFWVYVRRLKERQNFKAETQALAGSI